ncbi:RidA family protein [Aeromicrobium sp. CTD01-1L150]|uniref:RidA family protein n=1 Tax=Aeromicrobium sp. CTD01-1L150 TaxID=3341830 RepID=UPI0035BF1BE4
MTVHRIKPEGLAPAHGYAHATVATGSTLVHVGGQIAIDLEGNVPDPGDYRAQGELSLRHLVTALEAAGGTAADLAYITVYIVDLDPASQDEVFAGYGATAAELGVRSTGLAVIGVSALGHPEALVELTATAVLD